MPKWAAKAWPMMRSFSTRCSALQTSSEATQRLPQDLKERHPGIPWKRITGFRNILVHDYIGGIDPPVVWTIVRTELATLKGAILTELPDRPSVRQATISDSAEPDTL